MDVRKALEKEGGEVFALAWEFGQSKNPWGTVSTMGLSQ